MNEKFIRACDGKSASRGGLNLPVFRRETIKRYPKQKLLGMRRKELEQWCKRKHDINREIKEEEEMYFLSGSKISDKHKKYCRCVAHVAATNTDECYESGEWKKPFRKGRRSRSRSRGCVNPYPVCRSRIGATGKRDCLKYMDLDSIPTKEIEALAKMKGVSVSELKRKVEKERKQKSPPRRGRSRTRTRSRSR